MLAHADGLVPVDAHDERRPILLAISDNGPQMTSGSAREFMALHTVAVHFGRLHKPTDQAHIETLFGHVKTEYPHLEAIDDPAVFRAELDRVGALYNAGRGPAIRQARRDGLERTRPGIVWSRGSALLIRSGTSPTWGVFGPVSSRP